MMPGRGSLQHEAPVAEHEHRPRFEGDEAYSLRADESGVSIAARSAAGRRLARHTLQQLRTQYGHSCPALVVEDAPTFRARGVMLDVSRDRVPTMAQLFETIDVLAALKFNHLELYTEHTFAYAGHEEAWQGWSPITPAEARELDAHALRQGIELSANQNCFGHLSKWLSLPRYSHLAETHGSWVFENAHEQFHRTGPFSLCPVDPASGEFIDDLLNQMLPCFTSGLVNIGCDETFDVGFGRSADAVKARGRAAVYFEFVNRICATARRLGKRPMFWADIALSHPESASTIPEDMVCLAWDYEPTARFADWCRVLRSAQREVWVCPGTSSWRSITGRTSERRGNLRAAARDGAAGGSTGFLATDWGDGGHHQQWPISLAGIAEAADAAWSGDSGQGYDARAASLHVFGDRTLEAAPWLDDLGDADAPLRRIGGRRGEGEPASTLRNSTVIFNELFTPIGPGGDEKLRRGTLSVPALLLEATLERLEDLASRRPQGVTELVAREFDHTLDVAMTAVRRALWRRSPSAPERQSIARSMRGIIEEHRTLWLKRCRQGGLDDSCSYYHKVLEELA
jgi:hypothetical protein